MSSAGIVYKQYGKEVINNISKSFYNKELPDSEIEKIY